MSYKKLYLYRSSNYNSYSYMTVINYVPKILGELNFFIFLVTGDEMRQDFAVSCIGIVFQVDMNLM